MEGGGWRVEGGGWRVEGGGAHSISCLRCHVLAGNPPLRLQHGLDDITGALAERKLLSRIRLCVSVAAHFLHFLQHEAAALEAHETSELSAVGRHAAVVVEHADHGETVPLQGECEYECNKTSACNCRGRGEGGRRIVEMRSAECAFAPVPS